MNLKKKNHVIFSCKSKELHLIKIFLICIMLTLLTFILINLKEFFNKKILTIFIVFISIIQIIIQFMYLIYFKISSKSTKIFNIISIIFTTLIVIILTTGSLWIIDHLHKNLMP